MSQRKRKVPDRNDLRLSSVLDEIRTRVVGVKGRCPRPLDDEDILAVKVESVLDEIRTRVVGVKGRCPRPLDDEDASET